MNALTSIKSIKTLGIAGMLAAATLLTACGGSDNDLLPRSLTVQDVDASGDGVVGRPMTLTAKVLATDIGSGDIQYTWTQTQGATVAQVRDTNPPNYQSKITFTPLLPGDYTFEVLAKSGSNEGRKAKTVTISAAP